MSTERKHVMEKLRWWIASQMDRLPSQCWADLVSWALSWDGGEKRPLWSPIGAACRSDAAECGACYCGKLRAKAAPAQSEPVPR
jgi:hypothetical protein